MNALMNTSPRAAMCCSWCFWMLMFVVLDACQSPQPPCSLYEASFQTEPATRILVERKEDSWVVRNGEERVAMTALGGGTYAVPVFGGTWSGEWEGEEWVGVWTDSLRPGDYRVPVRLQPLRACSPIKELSLADTSYWTTTEGVLCVVQQEDSLWGTISTPTGDYRFLSGKKKFNTLVFNTFDGAHLFRFEAQLRGDSLVNGEFLSGTHYQTPFSGKRMSGGPREWKSSTQLPSSRNLTFQGVTTSGDSIRWTEDELLSLGKTALVLDVMGTWCPNCMDEARLLRELASDYPEVQFLSLAFERSAGASALQRLKQFRTEMELPWDVWLGGRASKAVAADMLSVVDTVHSFPTTLFWPLDGEPTVHKGFNGPATGEGYEVERAFFRSELNRISGRSENR